MEKLVQTTLRSIIGDMGLDDTLASREEIERGLEIRIKNVANNWGLEIKSVELLEITPTPTIEVQYLHCAAPRGTYNHTWLFTKAPFPSYATGCHAQAVGRGACAACRYCDG